MKVAGPRRLRTGSRNASGATRRTRCASFAKTPRRQPSALSAFRSSLISARSDGTAVREAWRRYAHAFLTPVGEIVAAELGEKLDAPGLALDFSSLFASDITGRARAFGSMVQAGMDIERAAGLSGLLAGAGEEQ